MLPLKAVSGGPNRIPFPIPWTSSPDLQGFWNEIRHWTSRHYLNLIA